jgi:nucleoside-diphosphate-sugar epimerase
MKSLLQDDLQAIVSTVDWEPLRGAKILLTGGTGFIGSWLVESFDKANRELDLKGSLRVLSRHNLPPRIGYIRGDVRMLPLLDDNFTHIIHAACPASANLAAENPLEMFDICVEGTRGILDWATHQDSLKSLLFISSGAAEHRPGEVYGEAKRAAEVLCRLYAKRLLMNITIARPFALVGPRLPLDTHFAIGNFIRDAIRGGPVKVVGGTKVWRSYLYASDMAIWLWTLLMRDGISEPIDVGSDIPISICQLAHEVAGTLGVDLEYQPGSRKTDKYLPDIQPAQRFGLRQTVGLHDAILKTALYYR